MNVRLLDYSDSKLARTCLEIYMPGPMKDYCSASAYVTRIRLEIYVPGSMTQLLMISEWRARICSPPHSRYKHTYMIYGDSIDHCICTGKMIVIMMIMILYHYNDTIYNINIILYLYVYRILYILQFLFDLYYHYNDNVNGKISEPKII